MQFIEYLTAEWAVIKEAPLVIFTIGAFCAVGGFAVARFASKASLDVARERQQLAEEKARQVSADVDELRDGAASSADLAELRQKIENVPRIHTGPNPPDNPRKDDLWIQTD